MKDGLSVSALLLVAFSGMFLAYLIFGRSNTAGWSRPMPPPPPAPALSKADLREVSGVFSRNQNITEALRKHDLSAETVQAIVASARPVYDLARVIAMRPYWLYFDQDGEFRDFRYRVDADRYLTVYRDSDRFVPVIKNFPCVTRAELVSGEIDDSLFAAVSRSGELDLLALELAEIFMWDVDFYADIRRGDSFRLLVEKKYLEGQFVGYGSILAASLRNDGRVLTGIRFADEDGKPGYYSPDGRSLRKSFLKSPLKFGRITSRYSRARRHPILRIVRPHYGVDYAAPAGTPVQAVAAGTVICSAYSGGGGRTVRLRHAGGYETCYMHLARMLVRSGQRVTQGQVIGTVGSTGLATGPHLDFRVLQRGSYLNPSKVIFPPAAPVSQSALLQFSSLCDQRRSELGLTSR